jgi:hypothetical protein
VLLHLVCLRPLTNDGVKAVDIQGRERRSTAYWLPSGGVLIR